MATGNEFPAWALLTGRMLPWYGNPKFRRDSIGSNSCNQTFATSRRDRPPDAITDQAPHQAVQTREAFHRAKEGPIEPHRIGFAHAFDPVLEEEGDQQEQGHPSERG